MKLLLETLRPDDTVAIVTYAGSAGTALEPTQVKDKTKILAALNKLNSRGSHRRSPKGIRQAYELCRAEFSERWRQPRHPGDRRGISLWGINRTE